MLRRMKKMAVCKRCKKELTPEQLRIIKNCKHKFCEACRKELFEDFKNR